MITIIQRMNFNEVKIKMMEDSAIVINNRDSRRRFITGLVEFNNPNKGLACCFDSEWYPLYACIIGRDNKLHCSMFTIGEFLSGPYPDEYQLKMYNDNCIVDNCKIKCIHRPDGTKVYPINY